MNGHLLMDWFLVCFYQPRQFGQLCMLSWLSGQAAFALTSL
jgi:hypothetical protein